MFRPNHVLEWGEELGDSEGTWSQNGWSVVLKTGIDGGRITYTGTITADGRHMSGMTDVRNTNDKPTPWSVVRQ